MQKHKTVQEDTMSTEILEFMKSTHRFNLLSH
jgi:hypothetical protein